MAKGNSTQKKAATPKVDRSKMRPHERRAYDAKQAREAAATAPAK